MLGAAPSRRSAALLVEQRLQPTQDEAWTCLRMLWKDQSGTTRGINQRSQTRICPTSSKHPCREPKVTWAGCPVPCSPARWRCRMGPPTTGFSHQAVGLERTPWELLQVTGYSDQENSTLAKARLNYRGQAAGSRPIWCWNANQARVQPCCTHAVLVRGARRDETVGPTRPARAAYQLERSGPEQARLEKAQKVLESKGGRYSKHIGSWSFSPGTRYLRDS